MKPKPKANTPAPDCFVCERSGTNLVYLGCDKYRHDGCGPGSKNWKEWYDEHPEVHTHAGDILRGECK